MSKLISDYAQVEISNKVKDILRMYHSSSWHSPPEPESIRMALQNHESMDQHHPQQVWRSCYCWLLCMSYVCYLLNHISCESLKGQILLTKL